jgi:hypothetical protein
MREVDFVYLRVRIYRIPPLMPPAVSRKLYQFLALAAMRHNPGYS